MEAVFRSRFRRRGAPDDRILDGTKMEGRKKLMEVYREYYIYYI